MTRGRARHKEQLNLEGATLEAGTVEWQKIAPNPKTWNG